MPTWEEIVKALENPKYKWRTLRGVAKQLNASQNEIQKNLAKHTSEIIKSSIPAESGEELYTTRGHYRRMTSLIDRITSGVTQEVSATPISTRSSDFKPKGE